jgi:hypothetical protein
MLTNNTVTVRMISVPGAPGPKRQTTDWLALEHQEKVAEPPGRVQRQRTAGEGLICTSLTTLGSQLPGSGASSDAKARSLTVRHQERLSSKQLPCDFTYVLIYHSECTPPKQ